MTEERRPNSFPEARREQSGKNAELGTGKVQASIVKRLLTERPLPLLWTVAIAYLLIAPMALLIPPDVFARYPWTRGFTDFMAGIVPMIDRVVVYGHPHSDKLRCFLAFAWAMVPLLAWANHRESEKNNNPLKWGTGLGFWCMRAGSLLCATGVLFLAWYWPNFPIGGKDVLGVLERPYDERRTLLWSTPALFAYTPIWLLSCVAFVDFVRIEIRTVLGRLRHHVA